MINLDFIRQKLQSLQPQTLIILGSGLGSLGSAISNAIHIPYKDIPGFPQTTVSGHNGELICGNLEGREVICMQGRFHLYEGHNPSVIKEVICAFGQLGISELIVTNASGSLRPEMDAGSLMLIKDHINFSGYNPLSGPNDDKVGPRFPDLSNAYDLDTRDRIKQLAQAENIKLYEGVYLMVAGPNFETAAEIRAFQILGADAVGMSTVPEVIAAIYAGMRVLGISVITNLGTGLKSTPQSHAETLAQGEKAAHSLTRLIKSYLKMEA